MASSKRAHVIILHFGLKLDDCNLFSFYFVSVLLTIPQSIRHTMSLWMFSARAIFSLQPVGFVFATIVVTMACECLIREHKHNSQYIVAVIGGARVCILPPNILKIKAAANKPSVDQCNTKFSLILIGSLAHICNECSNYFVMVFHMQSPYTGPGPSGRPRKYYKTKATENKGGGERREPTSSNKTKHAKTNRIKEMGVHKPMHKQSKICSPAEDHIAELHSRRERKTENLKSKRKWNRRCNKHTHTHVHGHSVARMSI